MGYQGFNPGSIRDPILRYPPMSEADPACMFATLFSNGEDGRIDGVTCVVCIEIAANEKLPARFLCITDTARSVRDARSRHRDGFGGCARQLGK